MTLIIIASVVALGGTASLFVGTLWSWRRSLQPDRLHVVPGQRRFKQPLHPFSADEPRFEDAW